ncbi:MAG TPA: hypothetical protein VKB35_17740 [Ktedonobacteraceae bacterium]|nr:hypothetical protein [Ktedonobacteraceae bacterium]
MEAIKKRMSQFRYSNVPMPGYANRINQTLDNVLHSVLRPLSNRYAASIPELLLQMQEVTSPKQLTNLVNRLQRRIWHLSAQEQLSERKQVADALARLMQHATGAPLRLEAAGWLRLFVQAAYLAQPEQVFVTLVTAAVRASDVNEQRAYLKMTFDCFWPFRYPYAPYNWESFPNNAVFYPLAPLLAQENDSIQDSLLTIFAELPSLEDEEIVEYLLLVALAWSTDPDPERRQRITTILALMNNCAAQEALGRLQGDSDPLVSAGARRAAEKVRSA